MDCDGLCKAGTTSRSFRAIPCTKVASSVHRSSGVSSIRPGPETRSWSEAGGIRGAVSLAPVAHRYGESTQILAVQIREQLAKVVQSAGFRQCTRIKRFLIFIVEETLAQRGRQLCEYTIGVCVFDRNESFEPGLDPIVRNDARRLRHKLLEYYQQHSDARPDLVVITVPKGGYVPVFSRATGSAGKGLPAAYRLNVSLTRMADGAELISKTYDLESKSCSLQFELTGVDSDLQGDGHQ